MSVLGKAARPIKTSARIPTADARKVGRMSLPVLRSSTPAAPHEARRHHRFLPLLYFHKFLGLSFHFRILRNSVLFDIRGATHARIVHRPGTVSVGALCTQPQVPNLTPDT